MIVEARDLYTKNVSMRGHAVQHTAILGQISCIQCSSPMPCHARSWLCDREMLLHLSAPLHKHPHLCM